MTAREDEIRSKIIEDNRPWGRFKRYAHNETCTVKILTVKPGEKLSLQAHAQRDELWVALDEGLEVELGDRTVHPSPGDEIVILRNTKHRLSSLGKAARMLEVSFGHADEDDIVRYEDDYGRC